MRVVHGYSRTVLLTDEFAFKFPSIKSWERFKCGVGSNRSEAKRSRIFYDVVAPTLYSNYFGLLNIQPCCEVMPDDLIINNDRLERLLEAVGFDNKLDSFGILNGNVVAIDYHGYI
jgi:hypothetical protein